MKVIFPALIALALLIPAPAEACPLGRGVKAVGHGLVRVAQRVNSVRPKLLRNR